VQAGSPEQTGSGALHLLVKFGENSNQNSRKDHITVKLSNNLLRKI
jgi:hypothetical protein